MELLWEAFLQQPYFKNGDVGCRITLRCVAVKYLIAGAG
jgi:hypothetical protein